MMIEHVNIVVANAHDVMDFLNIAFPHWTVRGEGGGDWYGKPRRWFHFGDETTYIALSDHGEGAPRDLEGHTHGLAHIGIVVDDLDGLMAAYQKAGIAPSSEVRIEPGRKNTYYIDPQGLEWEFVQYLSDNPAVRNDYGYVEAASV